MNDSAEISLTGPTPSQRPWEEQWRRMIRWFEQMQLTYSGRPASQGGSELLADGVHAFFLNCTHLWDWIAEDLGGSIGAAAQQQVLTVPALIRARQLANGQKHSKLKASGERISSRSVTLTGVGLTREPTSKHTFEIEWTDVAGQVQIIDALAAAEECLVAWRSFLAAHGLTEPS